MCTLVGQIKDLILTNMHGATTKTFTFINTVSIKIEEKTQGFDLRQRRSVSLKFHITIHLFHLEACHTVHFV